MDAFIELFGEYTLSTALLFCVACGFVYSSYIRLRKHFLESYEMQKQKEETLQKTIEKMDELQKVVIEMQSVVTKIQEQQEIQSKKLEQYEEEKREREKNRIRDRLLQSHRYYTSKEKNPLQAWTRGEAQTFWEMFKDYDNLNGNGYVHSDVQPDMEKLEIIEPSQPERLQALYASRKY